MNQSNIEEREDGLYEKSTGRKIVSPLDRSIDCRKKELRGLQIISDLVHKAELNKYDSLCVDIALGYGDGPAIREEI